MMPTAPNLFEERIDVTVVVERQNCGPTYPLRRARNEIVTMYPGPRKLAATSGQHE
jgi:hypothetical protein